MCIRDSWRSPSLEVLLSRSSGRGYKPHINGGPSPTPLLLFTVSHQTIRALLLHNCCRCGVVLLLHTTPHEMLRLPLAAPFPVSLRSSIYYCWSFTTLHNNCCCYCFFIVCFFLYQKSITTHEKSIAVGKKWHFVQAINMCVWDTRVCMYINYTGRWRSSWLHI